MKKTTLALAIAAMAAAPMTFAVDYTVWGEIYVELTDTDGAEDIDLTVTTADFGFEITETFGEVTATGHMDFAKGDYDVAGITVEGAFGSVYVGDDGTGVLAADLTDNLENNSEIFFADPSSEVIDYGLPLSGPVTANIFLGLEDPDDDATTEEEDFDYVGAYGSFTMAGATVALGYTDLAKADDTILDLGVAYETGPIYAAIGFQDVDSADDSVVSITATYTAGAIALTPYYEEMGDSSVTAFNATYSFTDNFYTFFETADYSEESGEADNSELGLVLTF